MPRIQYPNVPDVAGVPALVRSPNAQTIVTTTLGVLQGALFRSFYVSKKWGIFKNGKNVLEFQGGGFLNELANSLTGAIVATNGFSFAKEFRVSDFPIEGGGFASYNKVETPSQPIVNISMSGTEAERASFLTNLEKLAASNDFYDVTTPEKQYINYTIESYSYSRTASKGAYMLNVEIRLREIRIVSPVFITTIVAPKAPAAKPAVSSGKVQAAVNETIKRRMQAKPDYFEKFKSLVKGLF